MEHARLDFQFQDRFRVNAGALGAPVPACPSGTLDSCGIYCPDENDGWVCPAPVSLPDGTRLHLYKDGQGLRAAAEAIEAAQRRIALEVYIFRDDAVGCAIADALIRKARQGLDVYLIYDSFGCLATDRSFFKRMRDAGVRIREFHPIRPWDTVRSWRPANRDHRKLLAIDNDIAGIGGLNIGGEYAGSWVVPSSAPRKELWRDNSIGVVGPAARALHESFARMWHYCGRGGRLRNAMTEHPLDGQDFGVLASVPSPRGSRMTSFIRSFVGGAKRSIRLSMGYFAPTDDLIEELCGAARRGVRVQLMLPGRSDMPILRVAGQSFYETLLIAGMEIYERQAVVLHTKSIVIDDQITILGSTNLDYRSIEYNCELAAVIRSADFSQHMRRLFEHDIRFSRRIFLRDWRHRPLLDRALQWAVKRARYLL